MAQIIITLLTTRRTRQVIDNLDVNIGVIPDGFTVVAGENLSTEVRVNYPEAYRALNCYVHMKNSRGEYATITFEGDAPAKTFTIPSTMTLAGNTVFTFYAENTESTEKTVWTPVIIPITATGVDYARVAQCNPDIVIEAIRRLNALDDAEAARAAAEEARVAAEIERNKRLAGKAEKSEVYTRDALYTKDEVDRKMAEYGAFRFRGDAEGLADGKLYAYLDGAESAAAFTLLETEPDTGCEIRTFTVPPFGHDVTVEIAAENGETNTLTYTAGQTLTVRVQGEFLVELLEVQATSGDRSALGFIAAVQTNFADIDSDTGKITRSGVRTCRPEDCWNVFTGDTTYGTLFYVPAALGKDAAVPAAAGDTWQVGSKEYTFDGEEWVELGFNMDLTGYAQKSDLAGKLDKTAENIGTAYTGHEYSAYLYDETEGKAVRRRATHTNEGGYGSAPNGVVLYDASGHIFVRDDMITHDGDAVNKKYVDSALGDVSAALAAILGV